MTPVPRIGHFDGLSLHRMQLATCGTHRSSNIEHDEETLGRLLSWHGEEGKLVNELGSATRRKAEATESYFAPQNKDCGV